MPPVIKPSEKYLALRDRLLKSNELFSDPEFPASPESLHDDGAKDETIEWKRPKDIAAQPEFIVKEVSRHDLDQGILGDCWFIAAAASVSYSHPKLFERIVPRDQGFNKDQYTGLFRFNFWWYGDWKEIIIDDFLPTRGGALVYGKCEETLNEFWPCLLEKAYAKLYGNYQNLVGGFESNAMVDMTGGLSEMFILQGVELTDELKKLLSDVFNASLKMSSLIAASILKIDTESSAEEPLKNGLLTSHAYSVTGFYRNDSYIDESSSPRKTGIDLIRLRNPWGSNEWTGAWSDNSPQCDTLPKVIRDELSVIKKEDGEFWMSFDDFIENFEMFEICHLDPDAMFDELEDNVEKQTWKTSVEHGAWVKGSSAGGNGDAPNEEQFWTNPQYRFTVSASTEEDPKPITLIASLIQKNKNNKIIITICLKIYQSSSPGTDKFDSKNQATLTLVDDSSAKPCREVSKRFQLSPGDYVIVPYTGSPDEESDFLLRLYSEQAVEMRLAKTEPDRYSLVDVCDDSVCKICCWKF